MLPKIDVPVYDLKLPSSGKEVKVRPFLVKEEKILLMAVKTEDPQEIIKTTKQVINNCLLDSPDVNIDTLPFFDIDYLFIALRAKSVGETIPVKYVCQADVGGVPCRGKFTVNIDIADVQVNINEGISKEIKFSDKLIFTMKYPTYAVIKTMDTKAEALDNKIKLVIASIDKIFTNNQYYTSKDFTTDELQTFIENLTQEQFNKLEEFVSNYPTFFIKAEGSCPNCGKHHTVRYDDFISFFQ